MLVTQLHGRFLSLTSAHAHTCKPGVSANFEDI